LITTGGTGRVRDIDDGKPIVDVGDITWIEWWVGEDGAEEGRKEEGGGGGWNPKEG
jgi:hypothetical protein